MDMTLIKTLKSQGKYLEITRLAETLDPHMVDQSALILMIAESYEKIRQFDTAAKWYQRACTIEPEEGVYGAFLNVLFAEHNLDKVKDLLKVMEADGSVGYHYYAAIYEIKRLENDPLEERINALKDFLEEQEEEYYMMGLIEAYLDSEDDQKALKQCKKLSRLFQSGSVVKRADDLISVIGTVDLSEYRMKQPWTHKSIFSYLQVHPSEINDPSGFEAAGSNLSGQQNEERKEKNAETKKPSLLDSFKSGNVNKSEEKETYPNCVEDAVKDCVGLEEVKEQLNNFFQLFQFQKARSKRGFSTDAVICNHFTVSGKNGTGKTKTANIISNFLYDLGVLEKATLITADYSSVVATSTDATVQNIQELFTKAVGGTLLIENLHDFYDENNMAPGMEAIDLIDNALAEAGDRLALIVTGDTQGMDQLLNNKKSFRDKFMNQITLKGYTLVQLEEITKIIAKNNAYLIDETAMEIIKKQLQKAMKQPFFEYTRYIDKMINLAAVNMAKRVSRKRRINDTDLVLMLAEDFDEKVYNEESTEELLMQLDSLTGLGSVKDKVRKMINAIIIAQKAEERGIQRKTGLGTLHLVFKGNAGTGKTTVARIIGKIYKNLGILQNGDVFIECTRKDLVSGFVGQTAKCVEAKVKEAMGGILFIDEAYALCKDENDSFGQEAVDALVADIENYRDNLMVILAGYSTDMDKFLSKNQGLSSRLSNEIIFDDYTTGEMVTIFKGMIKGKGLYLDADLGQEIRSLLEQKSRVSDFGNARGVRNVVEKVIENQNERLIALEQEKDTVSKNEYLIIRKEDLYGKNESDAEETSVDALLEELNRLTGLGSVKQKVQKMIDTAVVNHKLKEAGIANQGFGTLHLVFKGNAGTGKTTVARIIGKIYKQLGVLPKGDVFIETGRSDLVAGYVGQTAMKVKEKVKQALGGILFIDEAYSLCKDSQDSFGQEAIDTLIADIENHRDNLMLIVAGYSKDMDEFLAKNQGLSSRLSTELIFEDYTVEEMYQIFTGLIAGRSAKLSDEAGIEKEVLWLLEQKSKGKDFGNARGVRNVVDKVIETRNSRIAGLIRTGQDLSAEEYCTIRIEDVQKA
jgi:replication-associated recombination protein RarA